MLEKINHKSAPKEIVNALVTLYHQGKFDDVLSRSSQLIKEYPDTFVLHNIIGAISFEQGLKEVAIKHFRKVIELRPHHPHAYNNLGAALIDVGEHQEAKSNLEKAIELQPDYAEAYNNLGNVYKEMEEYNQAISVYEKAIELNPEYYEAYNNLGAALGKNEQYEEAEKVLKQVIKLQPELIESLNNLGSILTCMEKYEEAKAILNRSIKIQPSNAEALSNLGDVYRKLNEYEQAIDQYKGAIQINPNYYEAYNNMGLALTELEKYSEAKNILKQAIKINPDFAEAYNNLGLFYEKINKYEQAIDQYKGAIQINPKYYEALNNMGLALTELKKYEEAENILKQAIKIDPKQVQAYNNLGNINNEVKHFHEAKIYYKKVIELDPKYWRAYNNLGNVYRRLEEYNQAISFYKKTIEINPKHYEAFNSMGVALRENQQYEESKKTLNHVIKLKPEFAEAHYNLGNVLSLLGNNKNSIHHQKLAVALDPNSIVFLQSLLFYMNYSPDMSAEEIFEYYKQFDQRFGLPHKNKWKPFAQPKVPKSKLKIGYVSPDFKGHSMQSFLLPALPYHDHEKFEIFAFAELGNEDKVSQEYKSYVDHWIRTDKMKDDELAQKIRDMGIDILVDVAGHTSNSRLTVFAQKPAPVSLSWFVGYAYTTGLSAIDYFLIDKFMAPKGSEHLFSEKLWRLNRYASIWIPKKNNMGVVNNLPALSKGFITFGTLTRTIRINDRVIKTWADILTKVPNAKLIINSNNFLTTGFSNFHHKDPETINELKQKFKDHGISESRLDFYYKTPPWDSMRQIDIALDSFPHNSGTTLFEHLYMGNPFITYSNRPSVGKYGTSILSTLGHPEWIATSEEEYVDKAVALASDPQKLSTIRQNLRAEMEASPLMDQKGFVRELEETYQAMWKKWCSS